MHPQNHTNGKKCPQRLLHNFIEKFKRVKIILPIIFLLMFESGQCPAWPYLDLPLSATAAATAEAVAAASAWWQGEVAVDAELAPPVSSTTSPAATLH